MKNISLPLSNQRSCIYCNPCSLSSGESFFVFESRPASELGRMCIQVVLNILPNMWPHFNWDDSLCWIGGWVCNFFELSIDYKLSKSLSKARYNDREHRVALLSKVKQLLSRHLVSHWSWSLDTNELSTSYIEDPESHIARPFRLKSLFVSLMRTGSPP